MRKLDIDWDKFKELRSKGYRTQQIADELNIRYETLRKRAYKENLRVPRKTFLLNKKLCTNCFHYFSKKELISSRKGKLCKECYKKICGERRYGSSFISYTNR